jgi:hypothetical protein
MKKSLFIVVVLILFSCKKNLESSVKPESKIFEETSLQIKKKYKNCEELITDIIKSSNAIALNVHKDIQIRVEDQNEEKIIVELYVTNNISENPNSKKMADHSVGWLEFFPLTGKLHDITNDVENPKILNDDKTILDNIDLIKLCNLPVVNSVKNSTNNNVKCYQKNINDYSFKEVCEYDGVTDLSYLHNQLTVKFSQNDLLKKLPKNDTVYSTSSTPEIKYSIKNDQIIINLISEGGQTELRIYHRKNKGFIESFNSVD